MEVAPQHKLLTRLKQNNTKALSWVFWFKIGNLGLIYMGHGVDVHGGNGGGDDDDDDKENDDMMMSQTDQ